MQILQQSGAQFDGGVIEHLSQRDVEDQVKSVLIDRLQLLVQQTMHRNASGHSTVARALAVVFKPFRDVPGISNFD